MRIDAIEPYHAVYVRETGQDLKLRPDRLKAWANWLAEGYTEQDLITVIQKIKNDGRQAWKYLRFNSVVGDVAWFEQELALAKMMKNTKSDAPVVPYPPTRTEILKLAERKKAEAEDVREEHAFETSFGYDWQGRDEKRKEFCRLMAEHEELMKLWEKSLEEALRPYRNRE